MSDEKKDVTAEEKAKAAAAAKAKAAAAAKAKAAAAAKAKALAEQKKEQAEANIEAEGGEDRPEPNFQPDVHKLVSEESIEQHLETDDVAEKAAQAEEKGQATQDTPAAGADEKAKAAAAAKAKAAAAARAKAKAAGEAEGEAPADGDDEKAKAAAAAKAKAAAAAKAKAAAAARAKAKAGGGADAGATDDEKAKAVAAAKAKAAAAAAARAKRGAATEDAQPEEPKKPSVNQPYLDKYVRVITDNIGADVIEESYINELGKDVPTLVIKEERWFEVAQFLKNNEQLAFDYLSSLHGTDFETHMETYYHFYSYKEKQSIAIRVKLERDNASVASITPIWVGADWPERETYDLLGITFVGHPNLTRILLTDDWVGHPLRKDYEQHDEEV